MAKRKNKPSIKLPKITILPSGMAHTRVLINGERISITKETEEACIAEYLALKHRVIEAEEKTIEAEVIPSDATNKNLIWTSSNIKVAKIENGKIKAIGKGSCTT